MTHTATSKMLDYVAASAAARQAFLDECAEELMNVARIISVCLARGGKLLLCGNGGSAADAQHIAAEFVNRFVLERPPLPALALTTDTSVLTAVGNDYGFREVFSKQVAALGKAGDVLIGISTSGESENVLTALETARAEGLITVGLTGKGGGSVAAVCDHLLAVPSTVTSMIQETHILAGHLVCMLVDHFLFEAVSELGPLLGEA